VKRLAAAVAGVLMLAACQGVSGTAGSSSGGTHYLTVSAASSLTAAFTAVGTAFQRRNPGAKVAFNFGPSDGLASQIDSGAPVDVFASASPTWMDDVERKGPGVSDRADFARNELAVIVPTANPAHVHAVADLARAGVKLVLAAAGVPAGDYARTILQNAGVSKAALANVVSNEEDDQSVVAKVLSGDADAGIVYVTDLTPDTSGKVTLVSIPVALNVIATYPIAVVTGSQEVNLAKRFVDYVLGDGQQTLAQYGFLPVG
jgi:molybdate transport system substrate-binding protein